jgi:hypothetical protein
VSHQLATALLGGIIGGVLGVTGTIVTSYWGPRKLEERRERRREAQEFGPRKALLAQMLRDPRHRVRTLDMLKHVTGTSDEECRRLLIEIGARGVLIRGEREGWALIERFPLDEALDESP